MNNKRKLLIIGIVMNCAGTEKSFLSFANQLDYEKWDVDLLLAKREGDLLSDIPKQINVLTIPDSEHADMFLLSGKNAAKTVYNCFIKNNPFYALKILPYFLKIVFNRKKKSDIALKMWCDLLQDFTPFEKEYDVAAAYWGDRTMFYMCDKVKAKKKIAWLHFDYGNPPRDDNIYLDYFKRCDGIVTVSEKINASLQKHFPSVSDKCVTIENINAPAIIWKKAMADEYYPDRNYVGKRILSIGRISEQKGFEMVIDALVRLRQDCYECRWYIIGTGDEEYVNNIKALALDKGVADMLILLGQKMNPYPYLKQCDIYCQPSRFEGKPICVEEAKMLFKPIVATNYLSASEQLEKGELGLIADINSDSIYLKIRQLLDDDMLCAEFTQKLSERKYSNTEEIEKFYTLCDK